jgi:hypothetical protein
MKGFKDKRVGFDAKGTPFGRLRDTQSYYSAGYSDFILSKFCDGYIFQKNFRDYEGCTVDHMFVTEENFEEALNYLSNPRLRTLLKNPPHFLSFMQNKADFKAIFGDLE